MIQKYIYYQEIKRVFDSSKIYQFSVNMLEKSKISNKTKFSKKIELKKLSPDLDGYILGSESGGAQLQLVSRQTHKK